jgi:hypothetical protein
MKKLETSFEDLFVNLCAAHVVWELGPVVTDCAYWYYDFVGGNHRDPTDQEAERYIMASMEAHGLIEKENMCD